MQLKADSEKDKVFIVTQKEKRLAPQAWVSKLTPNLELRDACATKHDLTLGRAPEKNPREYPTKKQASKEHSD